MNIVAAGTILRLICLLHVDLTAALSLFGGHSKRPCTTRHPLFLSLPTGKFGAETRDELPSDKTDRAGDKAVQELLASVDNALSKVDFVSRESILDRVDSEHASDVKACSTLAAEQLETLHNGRAIPKYEWIYTSNNARHGTQQQLHDSRPLAIRTIGPEPILNSSEISLIRSAAEKQWDATDNSSTSRFTYQRKGNYEAHVTDLADVKPEIQRVMDECLTDRVYPMIRSAFGSEIREDDLSSVRFCVYDALIIRYNATEAIENLAGQPLHRDLGIVSVNIMLNDGNEFDGGGTFFENQLSGLESIEALDTSTSHRPLKPSGPGHAIAHLSNQRHAGSSTTRGVRDILVVFITADKDGSSAAPMPERAARLKSTARGNCQCHGDDAAGCRALYQRLAVDAALGDGEAWHYLGMALGDMHLSGAARTTQRPDDVALEAVLEASLGCLRHAAQQTPCDARLFNNLGLTYGRVRANRIEEGGENAEEEESPRMMAFHREVIRNYERAILLHRASEMAGCDVGHELASATLNYALYVSNLDMFREAAAILAPICQACPSSLQGDQTYRRIVTDAERLRRFCEERAGEE